jgi:acetyl-CoA C-acetyltransferase
MAELRKVAIIGGARIPFARSNTAYAETGNQEMLTAAMTALVGKFNLKGEQLGEVAAGALIKLPSDWNLARESTLGAGLHPRTPAYDLQRACGTSLSAVLQMGHRIARGEIDLRHRRRQRHRQRRAARLPHETQAHRAAREPREDRWARASRPGSRCGRRTFAPATPGADEPRTGMSMGDHTEVMAQGMEHRPRRAGPARLREPRQRRAAWKAGFFDDLVVPFQRPEDRQQSARRRQPADHGEAAHRLRQEPEGHAHRGQQHAAHGRRALACCSAPEEWAKSRGLPVLAYLTHSATAAVDYAGLAGPREGLLMAPTYAVPQMLDRAGIKLQDFDSLRDPRGLRRAGALHAEGLGIRGLLQEQARPRRAGRDRPQEDEPEGLQRRARPSLRRNRRAHRGDARQAAARARLGPGPDLDLHCRRHGRHGDAGKMMSPIGDIIQSYRLSPALPVKMR